MSIVQYLNCLSYNPIIRSKNCQPMTCLMSSVQCLLGAFAAYQKQGEEQRKAVECAVESFEYLEKQIQGKKFFSGEQIGYLDLAMGWIPHWLSVMEEVGGMKIVDAKKFPCLHQWTQDFIDIPLIKEPLPPRDKLVEYFRGSVSYMRSMATNKQ